MIGRWRGWRCAGEGRAGSVNEERHLAGLGGGCWRDTRPGMGGACVCRAVAIHEAGHAVAVLALGGRVLRIDTRRRRGSARILGRVEHERMPRRHDELVVALAGPEAERDAFLSQLDFLILALPLTRASEGLVGEEAALLAVAREDLNQDQHDRLRAVSSELDLIGERLRERAERLRLDRESSGARR